MRSKLFVILSLVIAASMLLGACTPAAPAAAPATEAPAAVEPTMAPEATKAAEPTAVAEVAKPTEAAAVSSELVLPEVDPSKLEGNIYSAGSSTVGPLSEAIQEMFAQDGFTGEIKNDVVGTGGGFERFCKTGETDLANASRAIKDAETENCGKLSPARTPIEFRVGTDAIAIVVNKENDFLKNVTTEELGKIFSDKAEKWSDVNAAWPAEAIKRFTPGTDSGTFDFFVETVVQKPAKIEKLDDAKKLVLNAKNLQTSEDDNVLVQGVEGDKYAIGYFGFAYYQQQKDRLNAVSINDITPSFETAESGKYLLSRPLFIYSDAAILEAKPQVAGFISYYLTNVNTVIEKVGYFPASEEALNGAKQALLDATGMSASTAAPAAAGMVLPEVDPSKLEGNIYSAGSSTVGPLSEAIQEMFAQDGFTGEIKNDVVGTGGGFERFCKTGETDVANASRKIKDAEKENCGKLVPARTPVEFRVGTDAIAVVVSKDNDFLTNVTKAELDLIFSDKAEKWSDVNAAWPAEAIKRFTPGTDSGTFDFFVETITQKVNKIEKLDDAKKVVLNAKNLQTSEDDNVLVQGVEGDKYAIGYFGFAYFQQQKDNLKAISVDDISPSFETAEAGTYVLSRPLFIYSDAAILKAKPQVAGFINYYLTNVNTVIEKVGYFPASEEALNGAKQALLDALK